MAKRKAKIIKDPKVRGEWVESVFMARAGEQGLAVSKPWGDSKSFDFVVGHTRHFVSVQVKSTTAASGGGYVCVVRQQGRAYARGSFDFVAAYVVQEDAWYIIPVEAMGGTECVTLCSKAKQAKYKRYREAWHLLREASKVVEEAAGEVEGGEVAGGDSSDSAEAPRIPRNAFERMEEAARFVRRSLEGGVGRGKGLGGDGE